MFQAFVVVLREGFEAFLIVAIIVAYLEKTRRPQLIPAVYWGIAGSVVTSAALGRLVMKTANEPLWEGTFGIITAILVGGLVIQMWRTAAHLKKDMENRLTEKTVGKTDAVAFWGVFLFTTLMISREGMEMALLLLQIQEPRIVTGIFLGIAAAVAMAVLWERFSYLINLKLFFQVTSVFLLLLVVQILLYSFHEFTEAGLLPNSEVLHEATEPFSPAGRYGKWFSLLTVLVCVVWLIGGWLMKKRVDFGKTSLRILILLSAVSFTCREALAHERHYVWNEVYTTLPQGEFEIEGWTTFKMPSRRATNKNTFQYQTELEYGVTDHLTIAHYQRWKTVNKVGPDDSTVYEGFKFEAKYRIGEKGKYWVDPLLYLEWKTDPRNHANPNALEGKIVLSKDIEKWNVTYNQILDSTLGDSGRTKHEYTMALGYEVLSGFRTSFEMKGSYWTPSSHRNKIALGPTLSYSTSYFWITAGTLFGANHAADDVEARVIIGVPF